MYSMYVLRLKLWKPPEEEGSFFRSMSLSLALGRVTKIALSIFMPTSLSFILKINNFVPLM